MKTLVYIGATSSLIEYASAGLHRHIHEVYHHMRRYAVEDNNSSQHRSTSLNGEPTLLYQAKQIVINIPSAAPSATSFSSIPLPSSSPPDPNSSTNLPTPVPTVSSAVAPPSEAPKPLPEPVEHAPPRPAPNPFRKATPLPVAKPTASISDPSEPSGHASGESRWCVTYSPYNADGSCKDRSSVSSDIAIIASKGFSSVRLYSPDCSGLQNVGSAAKSHNLSLVLGVFISENGLADSEAQISEITAWAAGDWSAVEMIVVGNEAIFNEYCTAEALAQFIPTARAAFRNAGFAGRITTTEPLSTLSEHAELLCPTLDVVAANIHPFFNGAVPAAAAGAFVAESLRTLESLCPGLESFNLETGWPSAGLPNGEAVPGPREQRAAIEGILKTAGSRSVVLGFANEAWKSKGEFEV